MGNISNSSQTWNANISLVTKPMIQHHTIACFVFVPPMPWVTSAAEIFVTTTTKASKIAAIA